MCSIVEGEFEEEGAHFMPCEEDTTETPPVCKKCESKNPATIKLPFKEAECEQCFLASTRHKFRATLGSSKILPKNSNVLLAFDGSPKSAVLLDMIHHAQTQNTFKRLHCNVKILHIDANVQNDTEDELNKVNEILKSYPFESYYMPLDGRHAPSNFKAYVENSELKSNQQTFRNVLKGIKSLTSQQDFILQNYKNSVRKAAKYLNCEFAFLSDINLDIATTLLTNISLGRGGSSSFDTSLVDDRESEVKLVRPLKDITEKEVEEYVKVQKLAYTNESDYGSQNGSTASIQNLTKDFVENLQNNFSSTVSTVFRVGDKIGRQIQRKNTTNGCIEPEEQSCCFCKSPLDFADSKTLFAIELSRIVSKNANLEENDMNTLANESEDSLLNGTNENSLARHLCHGCRNIQKDFIDDFLICNSEDSPNENVS